MQVEGKISPITCHEGTGGGWRYSSTLSLTLALERGWVVNTMPQLLYSWERDLHPLYRKLGGPWGLVWMGMKNLSPTRFEPWIV